MRRTTANALITAMLVPVAGFFLVTLFMMLWALPARGDHITEPTAPITSIDLHVYKYPDPQNTTLSCSGSEVVTFENMRVEARVDAAGRPSEHWNERLTLWRVIETPGPGGTIKEGQKYLWDVTWRHTNIPPHQAIFESHQTNQSLTGFDGAKLRWTDEITGNESGITLSDSCTFIVGNLGGGGTTTTVPPTTTTTQPPTTTTTTLPPTTTTTTLPPTTTTTAAENPNLDDCNTVVSMSQGRQVYNGLQFGEPAASPLEASTGEQWMLEFAHGKTLPWFTTASNWNTMSERHRCGTNAQVDRVVFIFDPREAGGNNGVNMIANLGLVETIVANRYPNAEFNPTMLVGATNHVDCVGNGQTASSTHADRIDILEASSFVVGPDLDIACNLYADPLGHLTTAGATSANQQMGAFYSGG